MANNDVINAYVYVSTGFHLRALLYAQTTECRWVIKNIEDAIAELDTLGLTYPRNQSKAVCDKLESLARSSGEMTKTPDHIANELHSIVDCIHDTVKSQAREQRLVLLQSTSVSEKLRELAKKGTLNTRQIYLFDEAVSNLETGAYRSAIVMGWNLAYDVIRQWIFDDSARLASFNTEILKILDKSGKSKFDPITNYTDFYDIGERIVLDVCESANFIGGNLHDDLRNYLRQRNSYAHASDSNPTVNQANALIDHLVDAIAKL